MVEVARCESWMAESTNRGSRLFGRALDGSEIPSNSQEPVFETGLAVDVGSSDPGPRGPKLKNLFFNLFLPPGPLPIDAP